jgi:hypothetical protein
MRSFCNVFRPRQGLVVEGSSSWQNQHNIFLPPSHMKKEKDTVSEKFSSLEHRTVDKIQKPDNV